MSRVAVGLCCLALLAVGCRNNGGDQQAYHHTDGRMKPVVALIPLIDSSESDLPWSLSDELTTTLHHRLAQKDKLYLIDLQKVQSAIKKSSRIDNPFGSDLNWVKKTFQGDEFVVFLELVQHEEIPVYSSTKTASADSPAELNMSMRIRVVDLREKEPRIVLQELIHDTHYIPKQFTQANFEQIPWGKDSFSVSPMGLAHAQLTKEISGRIEDYILLAKK